MTKQGWKKRIKTAMQNAGTYKPFFDNVIDQLVEMLEKRDTIEEGYKAAGSRAVISHTNKSGATNAVQNPALRLINDLNRDILAYWRDLGLTPLGMKRLTDKNAKEDATSEAVNALISAFER